MGQKLKHGWLDGGGGKPAAVAMVMDCLERHLSVWRSVARYWVVCNDGRAATPVQGTNTVIAQGLSYDDAAKLAQDKGAEFMGLSCWTKPIFNLKIENAAEAHRAVRDAGI